MSSYNGGLAQPGLNFLNVIFTHVVKDYGAFALSPSLLLSSWLSKCVLRGAWIFEKATEDLEQLVACLGGEKRKADVGGGVGQEERERKNMRVIN